jgi:hypothetical protein
MTNEQFLETLVNKLVSVQAYAGAKWLLVFGPEIINAANAAGPTTHANISATIDRMEAREAAANQAAGQTVYECGWETFKRGRWESTNKGLSDTALKQPSDEAKTMCEYLNHLLENG